jgi:hypothetical protein
MMAPSVSLLLARSSSLMPINQPVQISINKRARQHMALSSFALRNVDGSREPKNSDGWVENLTGVKFLPVRSERADVELLLEERCSFCLRVFFLCPSCYRGQSY